MAASDIITDSLSFMVEEWFEPTLNHPFLKIVNIPGATTKAIPQRWVDDVAIDDLFQADDDNFLAAGAPTWDLQPLESALDRLGLKLSDISGGADRMGCRAPVTEKSRVKQELKRYDFKFKKQFSRLPNHSEKEVMRPLYTYYRRLKTLISESERKRVRNVGSHSPRRCSQSPRRRSLESIPEQEEAATPCTRTSHQKAQSVEDQVSKAGVRIESLYIEKDTIRAKLQTFRDKFVSANGRKIRFFRTSCPSSASIACTNI